MIIEDDRVDNEPKTYRNVSFFASSELKKSNAASLALRSQVSSSTSVIFWNTLSENKNEDFETDTID